MATDENTKSTKVLPQNDLGRRDMLKGALAGAASGRSFAD